MTLYPGKIVQIDPAGPLVQVPLIAHHVPMGPLPTAVPDLQVGERVVVSNLGGSRDQLIVLARVQGRVPSIDEIPDLAATLDAHDIRLDAVEALNVAQDTRLDDIDVLDAAQNGRLDAVETLNATQDTRLDDIDVLDAAQNGRLDAVEAVANAAAPQAALDTLRADTAGVVDAKGDLLTATGPDVLARQPVGADGHALIADAAEATGLSWRHVPPTPLPFGHAGRTAGFQSANPSANPVIIDAAQELRGGMTFGSNGLIVPLTGMYYVEGMPYVTGGSGYRWTAAIARNDLNIPGFAIRDWKGDLGDFGIPFGKMCLLDAGDRITLIVAAGANSTWGTDGYNGSWIEVTYIGQ